MKATNNMKNASTNQLVRKKSKLFRTVSVVLLSIVLFVVATLVLLISFETGTSRAKIASAESVEEELGDRKSVV